MSRWLDGYSAICKENLDSKIYKMGKLIKLLNEWERERVNHNTKEYIKRGKNSFTRLGIIEVISKSYGFIEWLVENDKIDRPKVWLKIKDLGDEYGWFGIYSGIHIECLLMLLAIQDEPIEFLISILE